MLRRLYDRVLDDLADRVASRMQKPAHLDFTIQGGDLVSIINEDQRRKGKRAPLS